jgi:protein MAK11
MWDLMRGKPSASTLLGKEGELVRWSVDGSQFIVQSENVIDIYRTVRAAASHMRRSTSS